MAKSYKQKQYVGAGIIIIIGIAFGLYQFDFFESPEKRLLQNLETYKVQLIQIPPDDTYEALDFSEPMDLLIEKTEAINNAFKPLFTEDGFNRFVGNRTVYVYRDYYNVTERALFFDKIDVKSITFQKELHKAVIVYTLHYHDDLATTFSEDNQVVFLETDEGWLIDHETIHAKAIITLRYDVENAK